MSSGLMIKGISVVLPKTKIDLDSLSPQYGEYYIKKVKYATGINYVHDTNDVVETNEDGTFKFLSRNTDFINVGGYKVNLLEVEEEILKVKGVVDVSVYGRDNSVIGKILVADIVLSDGFDPKQSKKDIVNFLKSNLQPFKVPKLINVVKELKKNRTGKKVR